MALGDNYNNNKKNYDPTVYSDYKMSNIEGVDPSALSFSFWGKLLKVAISPKKAGDQIAFDHDNAGSVYLSHTKARVLAEELKMFLLDPNKYNNVGVPTGSNGLILISNGKELGTTVPCLIIRRINNDTGNIEASYAYQFKSEYHYGIRNFNEKSSKFDKIFYNNLELEQFVTLLEQYYQAMTGAIAYSVIDNMKFDTSRTGTKLDLIMDKLGIERKSKGGDNKSSGKNSYFNSNGSSSSSGYTQTTLDDIENQLEN